MLIVKCNVFQERKGICLVNVKHIINLKILTNSLCNSMFNLEPGSINVM